MTEKLETTEHALQDLLGINDNTINRKTLLIVVVATLVFLLISVIWFKHSPKTRVSMDENYVLPPPSEQVAVQNQPTPVKNTQALIAEQQHQAELLAAYQAAVQKRLEAPLFVVNEQGNAMNVNRMLPISNNNLTLSSSPEKYSTLSASPEDTPVQAVKMHNPSQMIGEGNLIHAVLETAINSDLPGYLRAITSEPVYAEDGTQILIPAGSRLIGQYQIGVSQGQARIFVIWHKLITPNHQSITLASPGVDHLGGAGIGADRVNKHFWEHFSNSALLSILSAGTSTLGVEEKTPYNASQAYRMAVADSFSRSATDTLKNSALIAPTLQVHQGKPIIVFIAHTLDFSKV